MILSYGELSTAIYGIVYIDAVDEDIDDIEGLLNYLYEHENSCVEID